MRPLLLILFLAAAIARGEPVLVWDGSSFRKVEQEQLATLKIREWHIKLYQTAEKQAAGQSWGLIVGPSAESCMRQLADQRRIQRDDQPNLRGHRYASKPFAVVERGAFGPSSAELAERARQEQARRDEQARAAAARAQQQAQAAARQQELQQQMQRASQERQRREGEARARQQARQQAEEQQRIYANAVAQLEAAQARQQAIGAAFAQIQELIRAKFEKARREDEARAAREEEREARREADRLAQQERAIQEQLERERQAAAAASAAAPAAAPGYSSGPVAEEAMPDTLGGASSALPSASTSGTGSTLSRILSQGYSPPPAVQQEVIANAAGSLLRRLYNQERDTRLLGEEAATTLRRGRDVEGVANVLQNEVLKDAIPENARMEVDAWRLLFARGASGDLAGHVNGHVEFAQRWIFDRVELSPPAESAGGRSAPPAPAPIRPRVTSPSASPPPPAAPADRERVDAIRRSADAVRSAAPGEPRRQQLRQLIRETSAPPADPSSRRGVLYIRAAAAIDLADPEACREARRALAAAGADQPTDDVERRILATLDQKAGR